MSRLEHDRHQAKVNVMSLAHHFFKMIFEVSVPARATMTTTRIRSGTKITGHKTESRETNFNQLHGRTDRAGERVRKNFGSTPIIVVAPTDTPAQALT